MIIFIILKLSGAITVSWWWGIPIYINSWLSAFMTKCMVKVLMKKDSK